MGQLPPGRVQILLTWLALVGLLLGLLSPLTFVDPDVFHEMALWRVTLEHGHVPDKDLFAYTPTVSPSIHHEWATGMVLYTVAQTGGSTGFMALKYALVALVCGLCLACAHRRGANLALLSVCSLVALVLIRIGFTTIRAQVFTLVALALLLVLLDLDRQGRRGWVWLWLPVHIAWLNLHGGFVVGLGVLGLHWLEQVLRHRNPQWHLVAVGCAMLAVTGLNPYGWAYAASVWYGVTLARPLIPEWAPLWNGADLEQQLTYLLSLGLLAYAVAAVGPRRLPGLMIVLVCGVQACLHARHLSLYAVAWWCYAPGFLAATPLAGYLTSFWNNQRRFVTAVLLALIGLGFAVALPRRPWQISVPTTRAGTTGGQLIYPAGAVRYLNDMNFEGNVFTPFTSGAYVSWHLYPRVRVSLDSRYEVAYPPALLEEATAFYQAEDGWLQTLNRYPTDLVLVGRDQPVASRMPEVWKLVYRDDFYELFAHPRLHLPLIDCTGSIPPGSFP